MAVDAIESEAVEHKLSLSDWRAIVETVAALATATGGVIRVGIAPNSDAVGVQIGRTTLERLANQIRENTEPSQYPSIATEGDESAAVINVRVGESPMKPVWALGRPLKRVGRTNQRLSPDETLHLMEATTGRTWDSLPLAGLGQSDTDPVAVAGYVRRALQEPGTTPDHVLRTLNLVSKEGMCNAAALLFAHDPQRYFPQAQLKCGRFAGTEAIDFLDQQTLGGTVFSQVEFALAFVARNTRQEIRITGRPEREIVPEYPREAVREAVVNAVCHRDYTSTATCQIRIFDDRLEVWNPGGLPPDLPVESLYAEHPSRPRNPRLAAALYRARLIEQWGTGTLRILRACQDAGLPQPEFQSRIDTFVVRFVKRPLQDVIGASTVAEVRKHRTVAYVRENGRITAAQYGLLFGLSERQAREDLKVLVAAGILKRKGTRGPNTCYVLPDAPGGDG